MAGDGDQESLADGVRKPVSRGLLKDLRHLFRQPAVHRNKGKAICSSADAYIVLERASHEKWRPDRERILSELRDKDIDDDGDTQSQDLIGSLIKRRNNLEIDELVQVLPWQLIPPGEICGPRYMPMRAGTSKIHGAMMIGHDLEPLRWVSMPRIGIAVEEGVNSGEVYDILLDGWVFGDAPSQLLTDRLMSIYVHTGYFPPVKPVLPGDDVPPGVRIKYWGPLSLTGKAGWITGELARGKAKVYGLVAGSRAHARCYDADRGEFSVDLGSGWDDKYHQLIGQTIEWVQFDGALTKGRYLWADSYY